jgi:hypothetical protein
MNITLTYISSATKNISLNTDVEIQADIHSQEGSVLALEVLENKDIYNKVELPDGSLKQLHKGDIIAGVLGKRRALRGFVGDVPDSLKQNDVIHVLNTGGVCGVCTSENKEYVGEPLPVRIVGQIVHDNKAANISEYTIYDGKTSLDANIPLIIISGTCMQVGKTETASQLVKNLTASGSQVAACKLSGVAKLSDILYMKQQGAIEVTSFLDAGFPSTVQNPGACLSVAKGSIDYLCQFAPDVIVIECGDGVLGEYGVKEVLEDQQIQQNTIAHIACAYDPLGAQKMVEIGDQIGMPVTAISGPVTDNSVGVDFVNQTLKIPAYNSIHSNLALSTYIQETCLSK